MKPNFEQHPLHHVEIATKMDIVQKPAGKYLVSHNHNFTNRVGLLLKSLAIVLCLVVSHKDSLANFVVQSNTTVTISDPVWTPSGDVIVEPLGKLIILANVEVRMGAGAKITVKINGRMHVTSATFIANTSTPWLGIEVVGNPNNGYQPNMAELQAMTVNNVPGGGTAEKGGLLMTGTSGSRCMISGSRWGIVVGEIAGSVIYASGVNSKGGGVVAIDHVDFRSIDYTGIVFTSYKNTTNNYLNTSDINECNFYNDKQTMDFHGIALYSVNLHVIYGCNFLRSNYNSYLSQPAAKNSVGIWLSTATASIIECEFKEYSIGVRFHSLVQAIRSRVRSCDFDNCIFDIYAYNGNATNINVDLNTSYKDFNYQSNLFTYFLGISGDDYTINNNTIEHVNSGSAVKDRGILYGGGSTGLGKFASNNTFKNVSTAIQSQDANFGTQFICNSFQQTMQDVAITSGGVARYHGRTSSGLINEWHSGCSFGTGHWHQNSGTSQTIYYSGTSHRPICITQAPLFTPLNANSSKPCQIVFDAPPRTETQDKIDSIVISLDTLPTLIDSMSDLQLSQFTTGNLERDALISLLTTSYIDSGEVDSAIYILSQYPSLRSDVLKLHLGIAENISMDKATLISSIASAYLNDSTSVYYDSLLGSQTSGFYDAYISLKDHQFSDSIVNVYRTALEGFAETKSFYGGLARTILELDHKHLFSVYNPADSMLYDTTLYPIVLEDLEYEPENPAATSIFSNPIHQDKISLYPNPAENVLHIQLPKQINAVNYRICAIDGRVEASGQLTSGSSAKGIDISMLKKGLHIIHIQNGSESTVLKFIRQ